MKYRPIVFDCDGVLADSESLGWEAMERTLGRYGVTVSDADIKALHGGSFPDDYAHFAARGSLPTQDAFWDELSNEMFSLFDGQLQAFEDAKDTLESLTARGIQLAVASNSPRGRLEQTLAATGLADLFDVTVSADDVANPKPAPDLYLHSARLLGVEAGQCVAVEDTVAGVLSAKAAGMWTVLVNRGDADLSRMSPDAVVPRLTPATVMLPAASPSSGESG